MKILGISGGMKDGANDSMCKEALMGAKEAGAEIEFIRLHDLNLKYCTGCVACSVSLVSGKGNVCSIKDDDFDWLLDKMLDADGILFATPIFEKGASAIFHTIMDRFGPRTDRGMNFIATKIAEEKGGKAPDPRLLQDKVISYIGIGGSDWFTRIQCDHAMQALSPAWKIIDNEVFYWSKAIILEDEKVAAIHDIGRRLAEAAKDIEHAQYQGKEGVCPHCHGNNFYLQAGTNEAICCLCGIEGTFEVEGGQVVFHFDKEKWDKLAHDTLSGKLKHGDDIRQNEEGNFANKATDEYKARVAKYKAFISATKP